MTHLRIDAGANAEPPDGSAPTLPPLSDAKGAFERVLQGDRENPLLGVFPTGDRAFLTWGATITGYVERGGPRVNDPSFSMGLPKGSDRAIAFMLGESPNWLVALVGSNTGIEGSGNYHAYRRRNLGWARIDSANPGWKEPASAAWDANSFWLFVPQPFQFINGTLVQGQYPCTGTRHLKLEHVGFDGTSKGLPIVDADFFIRGVTSDEKSHAFVWGWSACRLGLFVGELQDSRVSLEIVPGTDSCGDRSERDGLPAMQAQVFADDDGGLYVLNYPSVTTGQKTGDSCNLITLHHRTSTGAWSSRSLHPAHAAWSSGKASPYVTRDGIVWAATERPSALAWAHDGSVTEYPFSESCTHVRVASEADEDGVTFALDANWPVSGFVSTSPGDTWVVVRYGSWNIEGLCRLRRRSP